MPSTPASQNQRLGLIDVLRGVALLAMTLYHFIWDLEFFGQVLPGTIQQPGWIAFARSIATSFLFLSGISLVLAHQNGMRWNSFRMREIKIIAAASLVTLVTYFAFPSGFIFFGILHAIALFSLLALPFLRLPWTISATVGAAVLWAGLNYTSPVFNAPYLWWVGMATDPPVSNDYVPTFPWFAATLFGVSFAKLADKFDWRSRLQTISLPVWLEKPLSFCGRHALVFYLLHQPILLAMTGLYTTLTGPPDKTPAFLHACTGQCAINNDEKICRFYCGCVADGLKDAKLFTPYNEGKIDLAANQQAQEIISRCTSRSRQQ